jgi:hypothetical protein
MRKKVMLMLMVAALVAVAACAKKEVKVQSEDSKLAEEAFNLAENMRQAYVGKDFGKFELYTTEQGLRDVQRQLRDFESVELKFEPKWVEIDAGNLVLNVAWEGTWVVRGRERKDRGMAVFELTGRPLRLNRVLRSNPFKNPE